MQTNTEQQSGSSTTNHQQLLDAYLSRVIWSENPRAACPSVEVIQAAKKGGTCYCGLHSDNHISCLMELAARFKEGPPTFYQAKREGLDHEPYFTVGCRFRGMECRGGGKTLKSAKNNAARNWAIKHLRESKCENKWSRILNRWESERCEACLASDRREKETATPTFGVQYWFNLGNALAGRIVTEAQNLELKAQRITLAVAQLALHFSPSALAVFAGQIAIEFGYSLSQLITEMTKLLSVATQCSTKLIQNIVDGMKQICAMAMRQYETRARGETARRTDDSPVFTPEIIAGGAGILGGCAVLVAAMITGVKEFTSQKGIVRHIAEFSSKISKFKGGMYALMEMVKHFHLFVKDSVLAFLGRGTPATVVRAIESLNLTFDGKPLTSEKFFSMIEALNTLEGETMMGINPQALGEGKFVLYVLTKILTHNMTSAFDIPQSAIVALADTRRTLEARVRSGSLKQGAKPARFDPFCIWLAGKTNIGKSTSVSVMQKYMKAILGKDPTKFQLPAEDRFSYAANFNSKHYTGYNGQYVFTIDDMCQDVQGTSETSSAMFLINAKSRVPTNVPQAALEDKLCPFDSKIIICTSNHTHPSRNQEITDNAAFMRRRDVLLLMEADEAFPEDEDLHRRVRFSSLDPMDESKKSSPLKVYSSFKDMMKDIMKRYITYFEQQSVLDQLAFDTTQMQEVCADFWGPDAPVNENSPLIELTEEGARYNARAEIATPTWGWLRYEEDDRYSLPTETSESFLQRCKFEACRISYSVGELVDHHYWKLSLALGAAVAIGLTAYLTYNFIKPLRNKSLNCESVCVYDDFEDVEPERDAQVTYNKELVRARAKAAATTIRSSFVEAMNVKNVVKVSRWIGSKKIAQNGVFVKDRLLLTCLHFFTDIEDEDEFEITEYPQYSAPVTSHHVYSARNMRAVIGAKDSAIYSVGFGVNKHKNIVARFNQADLPKRITAASVGVYPSQENYTGQADVVSRLITYKMRDEDVEEIAVEGFEMYIKTQPGRSGSVLVSDESHNRAPTIFGIQTSMMNDGSRAYFEALSRDQIERTLALFGTIPSREIAVKSMECGSGIPPEMEGMCQKSLIYLGRAQKPVHQMRDSKLRKSAIYHEFEVDESLTTFAPSALSSRNASAELQGVDVLLKSMAGYDRQYGAISPSIADEVLTEFIQEDKSVRRHPQLDATLLTDDEIINGIDGLGLKGVEVKTSPGLPYTNLAAPGKQGKETWITRDDNEKRILDRSIWKIMEREEEMLSRGEFPDYLAYACLKDELRPIEKVENLQTRSFVILPMTMNFLIRKYFGKWTAVQHCVHNRISSSVGVDANTEWTVLKRRLLTVGEAIEDFDYKDWDRSLHAEWFRIYGDRVSAWYGDKEQSPGWMVRRSLMDILAHMPIQIGQHVVQTVGGNKSGCAITAEVNSDVHDMLMLYVWKQVCADIDRHGWRGLDKFREKVALALYGDDVVKATSSSTAKWFNGTVISKKVAKLGMLITPGNKVDKEFTIKTIDEVTFLKRRFLEFDGDCGLVRAPLDKAVIQRMLLWIHKSDEPLQACADNVKGALCEAFFWGEAYYHEFREKIEKAWGPMHAHNVALPVVSYRSLHQDWSLKRRSELLPAQFQYAIRGTSGDILTPVASFSEEKNQEGSGEIPVLGEEEANVSDH